MKFSLEDKIGPSAIWLITAAIALMVVTLLIVGV